MSSLTDATGIVRRSLEDSLLLLKNLLRYH